MEEARALDRRRVAQINNQRASIDRLLKNGEYGEEMRILHEGAAELVAQNEAVRGIIAVVVKRAQEVVSDAVNYDHGARTFAADVLDAFSAPVSESGASAG